MRWRIFLVISSSSLVVGFDVVGSLMLMPDRVQALRHVYSLLKPDGFIIVTQTFEGAENRLLELIKPLLYYIISVRRAFHEF